MNGDNELNKIISLTKENEYSINNHDEIMTESSIIRLDDDELCDDLVFEVPLNIIKEKVLYSLPARTEVDENCYVIFNKALNHFLKYFSSNLPYQHDNEKKILIKDIKTCMDNDKKFSFLKRLIEK